MKIIDKALVTEFSRSCLCEWCKVRVNGCDAHHYYFSRGAGGSDVRLNLVSLCRFCHTEAHAGNITREDLLAVVAVRDGLMQDDIIDVLRAIRNHPKHLPIPDMLRRFVEAS